MFNVTVASETDLLERHISEVSGFVEKFRLEGFPRQLIGKFCLEGFLRQLIGKFRLEGFLSQLIGKFCLEGFLRQLIGKFRLDWLCLETPIFHTSVLVQNFVRTSQVTSKCGSRGH